MSSFWLKFAAVSGKIPFMAALFGSYDIFDKRFYMSNFKKIVRIAFENTAEEHSLYSSNESAPLVFWSPPIGRVERELLEAIVFYRAKKIGCTSLHLHAALECRFQVDGLPDITSSQFEDAMAYLLSYAGAN